MTDDPDAYIPTDVACVHCGNPLSVRWATSYSGKAVPGFEPLDIVHFDGSPTCVVSHLAQARNPQNLRQILRRR